MYMCVCIHTHIYIHMYIHTHIYMKVSHASKILLNFTT